MPMKLSPNAVARVVGVPRSRIERPVNGHAAAIGVLMRFVFRQYYASPLYGAATASVVDVASCRDRIGLRDVVCQRDQSAIAPFLPLGKISRAAGDGSAPPQFDPRVRPTNAPAPPATAPASDTALVAGDVIANPAGCVEIAARPPRRASNLLFGRVDLDRGLIAGRPVARRAQPMSSRGTVVWSMFHDERVSRRTTGLFPV